jgi:mannose-6-phosphate isomerase-like protein (cupin superfamily)
MKQPDTPGTGHSQYAEVTPYHTKDGSIIRELMHPGRHGCRNQSLAEARIPAGSETHLHRHLVTEEFYHVVAGRGRMTLGDSVFGIGPGDTVAIPPGTPHRVNNPGDETLVILCCCAPAYAHDDTELL